MKTSLYRASNLKSIITFLALFHSRSQFSGAREKNVDFYNLFIIRECGTTLYVWLARTVPPTNTNFRLTFLLTRLQEAIYEDLPV